MNALDFLCILIASAAVIGSVLAVILYRRKTRKTLVILNKMLDAAIEGSFTENIFDESVLSAVEAKLFRFLSLYTASSRELLLEKDKIKELISDISHQTKTPVANILLYAELLGESELSEDCALCVKALSAQAAKLNFLISALVKTSRLETGIITVRPQQEEIQVLIERALEQIRPEADAKGVDISVEEDTEIGAIFDLKWTTEALCNILDNAVKYTACGGSITIKAAAYEFFARIDITDSGIGIAEEEHGKIFSRFYRSPAVAAQEGVGIGLYLAREIVTAGGGYLKVTSQPGRGSTFSVYLPRSR